MAYWVIIGTPILAAALCAGLLVMLLPWFKSYALSQPVSRSLHREPTPQGGGLGVVLAALVAAWFAVAVVGEQAAGGRALLLALTAGVVLLTLIGLLDDMRGLSPAPRLLVQCLAVGLILLMLPAGTRLFSALPLWVERSCLLLTGIWFVNLVNFMDGIDWMTVAEAVPITAAMVVLGFSGLLPLVAMAVALALLGGLLGFAPFNKPVARLFLGDVGSLPIGLMLGWLLLILAADGHLAAALLLPLYYLADASITLILRIRRRETLWHAHRTHFYQRAVAAGMSVPAVIARVFATNAALAALAIVSVVADSTAVSLTCLVGGAAVVGALLAILARRRR